MKSEDSSAGTSSKNTPLDEDASKSSEMQNDYQHLNPIDERKRTSLTTDST